MSRNCHFSEFPREADFHKRDSLPKSRILEPCLLGEVWSPVGKMATIAMDKKETLQRSSSSPLPVSSRACEDLQ